jgi:type IV fimbrial biogenesis protein FimT
MHSEVIMKRVDGFNLIELLIAICLLAIIVSLAWPSFGQASARTHLGSAESTVFASINNATNDSFLRGQRLVMCPSDTSRMCISGHEWSQGWIVFEDNNENRQRDQDERLVQTQDAFESDLRMFSSVGRTRIVFQAGGANFGSNAHFKLCHPDYPGLSRSLYLANNGRTRVKATPNIPCSP